jgi:hypothetical protein
LDSDRQYRGNCFFGILGGVWLVVSLIYKQEISALKAVATGKDQSISDLTRRLANNDKIGTALEGIFTDEQVDILSKVLSTRNGKVHIEFQIGSPAALIIGGQLELLFTRCGWEVDGAFVGEKDVDRSKTLVLRRSQNMIEDDFAVIAVAFRTAKVDLHSPENEKPNSENTRVMQMGMINENDRPTILILGPLARRPRQ